MNKDQQAANTKLIEVLTKIIKSNEPKIPIDLLLNVCYHAVVSEAAKEYWQSQQSVEKVDFEMLRGDFVQYAWNNGKGLTADKIFDWFLPHLQPAKEESDAVEFMKWCFKEGWSYCGHKDLMTKGLKTISVIELYAEFKTTTKKA